MTIRSEHHQSVWESYWGGLSGAAGEAFWDSDPAFSAALDLPRFKDFVDSRLPLVDVGCGNGTQTRWLGRHFARVIGVDVAEKAVQGAARFAAGPGIEYRCMDALRPEQARALHQEIGDANIYVRTVLHTFEPDERVIAAESLKILLGKAGILYLLELSPTAEEYFRSLVDKFGEPPPGLVRVREHGITPGRIHAGEIDALFSEDRIKVLASGDTSIRTTQLLPDGTYAEVPAFYRVLKPL